MNETEAAILADMDFDKMTDETQYGEVTDIFLRRGVPHVVVTLGAKGAYYSTRKGISGLVKAETSVVVKDTTGAGYVNSQQTKSSPTGSTSADTDACIIVTLL